MLLYLFAKSKWSNEEIQRSMKAV
jgi:hypothetical protein